MSKKRSGLRMVLESDYKKVLAILQALCYYGQWSFLKGGLYDEG